MSQKILKVEGWERHVAREDRQIKLFKLTLANTEGKGWKFICVSELSGSVQKVPVYLEATDATHTRGSLKEETWTYRSLSV